VIVSHLKTTPGPKPKKPVSAPAPIQKDSDAAGLNELLSLIPSPDDLVQIRTPSKREKNVRGLRNIVGSRASAQIALSLAGAALGGPVGLAAASVLNGAMSFSLANKNRLRSGAFNAVASAALGSAGLLPGGVGALATAGVTIGAARLIAKKGPKKIPNIRLDQFAPKFIDKLQANLQGPEELKKPSLEGLTPKKAEKVAAQALSSALKVCCDQLSPRVAVALARDTAKEMIAPYSVEEFRFERMIAPTAAKQLGDNVYQAELSTATPAAASTHKTFLSPKAPQKYSENALAAMLGHETSHVENRDIVANLGGTTLKTALRVVGNTSWNPIDWVKSSSMERKVDLAVAEISRENEYRCDQEGAQKLLDLGAEKEVVNKAFQEIFGPEKGSKSPTAAHPLPKDRIAAIENYLKAN
jgi:Zn-dependent protease with chaperone function